MFISVVKHYRYQQQNDQMNITLHKILWKISTSRKRNTNYYGYKLASENEITGSKT